MSKPLKPLPLKPEPKATDENPDDLDLSLSNDFDDVLAAEAEAARNRPLSEFAPAEGAVEEPDLDVTRAQPKDAATEEKPAEPQGAAVAPEQPKQEESAASAQPTRDAGATPPAQAKDAAGQPAPAQPAPQTQPVAPAPFDSNEAISLTADYKLTRGQMIQALNERHGAMQEADSFRQTFRMTAQQAEQTWKPLIDKMLATPALGQYLEDCIKHFEENSGKNAPAPEGQPYGDPEARAQITRLEAELRKRDEQYRSQEVERAKAAIAQEQSALITRYPALSDPQVMQMVAQRAFSGLQQDPQYTLTRAANDLATYLERLAPPAAGGQPKPAEVPALVGSAGASPTGSRRQERPKPKTYASADDAADAWINGDAAAAGFGG